jgi:hypothetical protein
VGEMGVKIVVLVLLGESFDFKVHLRPGELGLTGDALLPEATKLGITFCCNCE